MTEAVATHQIQGQNRQRQASPIQLVNSSRSLLLGFLCAGLTLSSNSVYGQLNEQYRQQENEKERCERDWWPNAQYKHESRSPESRMLVRNNNVFIISFKEKCTTEFNGYINKDYIYSPKKVTHFSIESGELAEYYKHPNKPAVFKRIHTKLLLSDKDGSAKQRGPSKRWERDN